jgi:hypothetical protein
MSQAGYEPAIPATKTHALDRATTGIGCETDIDRIIRAAYG